MGGELPTGRESGTCTPFVLVSRVPDIEQSTVRRRRRELRQLRETLRLLHLVRSRY